MRIALQIETVALLELRGRADFVFAFAPQVRLADVAPAERAEAVGFELFVERRLERVAGGVEACPALEHAGHLEDEHLLVDLPEADGRDRGAVDLTLADLADHLALVALLAVVEELDSDLQALLLGGRVEERLPVLEHLAPKGGFGRERGELQNVLALGEGVPRSRRGDRGSRNHLQERPSLEQHVSRLFLPQRGAFTALDDNAGRKHFT